jgi:alkylation response protein AidB-like acyl-CoA dehydrogenase
MLDDPDAREQLVEIFVRAETNRLLGMRNYWMNRTHVPMTYHGSQGSYVGKMSNMNITQAMSDAFGPYSILSDDKYDFTDGAMEQYQRNAIVILHPGGTADIQKVIMARRIGAGREEAESAGKTVE